jgi:hypothetical protein
VNRLGEIWRRLAGFFRRDKLDRDLEDEMRFHLEMKAKRNREAGIPAEEARHAARRQFGNATLLREQSRDAWAWRRLEELARDTRFAARMFRRSPVVTAAAVATLALTIGAASAVFSVINAVMMRPLPYPESERLVMLWGTSSRPLDSLWAPIASRLPRDKGAIFGIRAARLRDLSKSFAQFAWYRSGTANLTGNGEVERVNTGDVSPDFFASLGVKPALGRTFSDSEDNPVVILSDGFWRRRFASNPNVIGQTIQISGRARTVIGVMPVFQAIVPKYS